MKKAKDNHKGISHLSPRMRKWYAEVCESFLLEPHHLLVLGLACEAYDRSQHARRMLDAEGSVYIDRFDVPHPRPEIKIELDNRASFLRCLREMGLDLADNEAIRPPAITGTGRKAGA